MQNSQCVLSKWKNKHICQVKYFDKLLQCSVSGAKQPFSGRCTSVKMLTNTENHGVF